MASDLKGDITTATEHTSIPWTIHEDDDHFWRIRAQGKRLIAAELFANDAAFIVRAVNCHDELVEALEGASQELNILLVAYEQPKDDIRRTIEAVLAKIEVRA